jgi:hypothetical protein
MMKPFKPVSKAEAKALISARVRNPKIDSASFSSLMKQLAELSTWKRKSRRVEASPKPKVFRTDLDPGQAQVHAAVLAAEAEQKQQSKQRKEQLT